MTYTEKVEYDVSVEHGSRFPERIETDRLVFRGPIEEAITLGEFHRFHSGEESEKIVEPMNLPSMPTVDDAEDKFSEYNEEWEQGETAYYALFEKERSEGYDTDFCGLALLSFDWETRSAMIGVWMHPAVWGQGYSAERAEALLDVAFNSPVGEGIDVVDIIVEPDNEKSMSAVEDYLDVFGGHRVGLIRNHYDFNGRDEPVDLVLFQITREEYRETYGGS